MRIEKLKIEVRTVAEWLDKQFPLDYHFISFFDDGGTPSIRSPDVRNILIGLSEYNQFTQFFIDNGLNPFDVKKFPFEPDNEEAFHNYGFRYMHVENYVFKDLGFKYNCYVVKVNSVNEWIQLHQYTNILMQWVYTKQNGFNGSREFIEIMKR